MAGRLRRSSCDPVSEFEVFVALRSSCDHVTPLSLRLRVTLLVLALLLFVVSVDCSAGQPGRLGISGRNSFFAYDADLPFSDYIKQSREMVATVRIDLNQPLREQIIAANTPFELLPDPDRFPKTSEGRYAKGALLIHGLSDSPYHLKDIGAHLRDQGFLVRALVLPGHGTVSGDLIEVTHGEWIKATEYGVRRLRPLVDKLYVVGSSTGGALALNHALGHDDLDGLLLFSPALEIKTPLAWLAGPLRHIKTWLRVEDDLDFAKYESFAVNGAAQIYTLTRKLATMSRGPGGRVTIPVFIVLSLEDYNLNSEQTLCFFDTQVTNPRSRILVYAGEPHPDLAGKPRYILAHSGFGDQQGRRILDFAHTSITLPPGDPHYGMNGEYRNCLHYRRGSQERQACLNNDDNLLGEISAANLQQGIVQRLTCNPRYDLMIERLDDFLEINTKGINSEESGGDHHQP